jgi:hypothetical protein
METNIYYLSGFATMGQNKNLRFYEFACLPAGRCSNSYFFLTQSRKGASPIPHPYPRKKFDITPNPKNLRPSAKSAGDI